MLSYFKRFFVRILNIRNTIAKETRTSQRYYAAKDARESSLVAFQWITLFSFRFLLMMGLGVLAVGIAGKISEPEMALPAVISHYVPVGVKGLLIAALLAAAMSSVDSIINSFSGHR